MKSSKASNRIPTISFVFISISIVSYRRISHEHFYFEIELYGVFHLFVRSKKRRDSSSGNAQTRETTNKKNFIARKLCV